MVVCTPAFYRTFGAGALVYMVLPGLVFSRYWSRWIGGILDCEVCTADLAARRDSVMGGPVSAVEVERRWVMVISKATHRWRSIID